MVSYTIGLVRRKGPIIFDRLIGKWVTENSQLSKTTTQTGCSGVPCAFIRIAGTFLLPCGGGLASALLLRVGETCFFIFSSRIIFSSRRSFETFMRTIYYSALQKSFNNRKVIL